MGTSASCSYSRAAPALAFGPQGGPGVGTPSATSCTATTSQTPAAGLPCSTGATGAPPSSSFIGAAPEPAAAPGATIIFSEQDFQHHTGKAMADATAAQVMDMLRKQLTTTNPGGPPGWSAQHIDLSDGRLFDWRSYLVGQGLQTVRCGITAFGAGFIKHVADPNRLGQGRFDFIAFLCRPYGGSFPPKQDHHQVCGGAVRRIGRVEPQWLGRTATREAHGHQQRGPIAHLGAGVQQKPPARQARHQGGAIVCAELPQATL